MRRLLVVVLCGAMLVAAAMLMGRGASAQGPLVGATDANADPGGTGTAELYSHDFSDPGLGAWTIDIVYDPSVITITDCNPVEGSGVCNPAYEDDKIRVAGAVAFGLDGDSTLTRIEFECSGEGGTSPLDVQPHDVSDATIGGPVLLDVEVSDGVVSCDGSDDGTPTTTNGGATPTSGTQGTATPAPAVPDAGTGSGTPEAPWQVLAMLMLVASLGLISVAGLRVFSQRTN